MTRYRPIALSLVACAPLAAAVVTGAACWGDKDDKLYPHECQDLEGEGRNDAEASNPSCMECNYADHWNLDALETEEEKDCYANGWLDYYDYDCFEPCYAIQDDPDVCCRDTLDWIIDQMVAEGIWRDYRE